MLMLNCLYLERCRCKKVVFQRDQYSQEFERLDLHQNLSQCINLVEYSNILPSDYLKILNSWNVSFDETIDTDIIHNLTDGENSKEKKNSWKPEFYVSQNCEIIYYHKQHDQWHVGKLLHVLK